MPQDVVSIHDGKRTTVNGLMGNPKVIPTRVIDRLRNQFITEALLTDGGTSNTMEISFERNTQVFLEEGPEVVGEFGIIPAVHPRTGDTVQAMGSKMAYGVEVSREMRDYNKLNQLNKSITQLVNTFIRTNSRILQDALIDAKVPEIAASVPWNQQGADPRYDISLAMETVASGNAQSIDDENYSFIADTIAYNPTIAPALVRSDEWNKIYNGNIANESIRYTGKLPNDIMGLANLTDRTWKRDRVLVLERGVTGFYVDPRPLEATSMYPKGGGPNGGENETWRSNVSQIRINGIDEPFSACWITGVYA